MKRVAIGVDPGLNGAIVFPCNRHLLIPLDEDGVSYKKLRSLIPAFIQDHDVEYVVFVENQQVRGRQGGGLTIGYNLGTLVCAFDHYNLERQWVEPAVWVQWFGINKDKDTHIQKATELGFTVPTKSTRKGSPPHDGIADAFLIREYGSYLLGESNVND